MVTSSKRMTADFSSSGLLAITFAGPVTALSLPPAPEKPGPANCLLSSRAGRRRMGLLGARLSVFLVWGWGRHSQAGQRHSFGVSESGPTSELRDHGQGSEPLSLGSSSMKPGEDCLPHRPWDFAA